MCERESRRGDSVKLDRVPITEAMQSTALAWEQTLAALLPLVGRRLHATILIDKFPVATFGGRLDRIGVEAAPVSGVEEAES